MNFSLSEADATTAAEFRFDLAKTMVMTSRDGPLAVAIAPWTSTGFHENGAPVDRAGRATIALVRQPDGRWHGVHSNMSLARGVSKDSHGKRAVKTRQVRFTVDHAARSVEPLINQG